MAEQRGLLWGNLTQTLHGMITLFKTFNFDNRELTMGIDSNI